DRAEHGAGVRVHPGDRGPGAGAVPDLAGGDRQGAVRRGPGRVLGGDRAADRVGRARGRGARRAEPALVDHHHVHPAGLHRDGGLAANGGGDTGLWVKFAKKKSGIASITMAQALKASACFGWVDSKMQGAGQNHYILRYQPRKARSAWSLRNAALAERLMEEG